MKNLFIVANWKANKTEEEAINWFSKFKESSALEKIDFEHKEVVICPSYHLLPVVYDYIKKNQLPLRVGSQDISQFGKGAYTGETPSSLIYSYITFSIIGHSERRKYFGENDEILQKKVSMALSAVLLPIFCVENSKMLIPQGVKIVAYEPAEAIGSGKPDTPENADNVALDIKRKSTDVSVLYGGSVNAANVSSFTKMPNIDGVLVGGASLDPLDFFNIVKNA
ncbi:MAG: triose-phosphate isomerase family protein [Candidatus Levybacteria bacterium]|nr:triose-phosphate isomerase family protein [Candidatus Levybacteria bacterium]